jgi:hypothetical protein
LLSAVCCRLLTINAIIGLSKPPCNGSVLSDVGAIIRAPMNWHEQARQPKLGEATCTSRVDTTFLAARRLHTVSQPDSVRLLWIIRHDDRRYAAGIGRSMVRVIAECNPGPKKIRSAARMRVQMPRSSGMLDHLKRMSCWRLAGLAEQVAPC